MLNVIRIVALGLWVGALAGFAFLFAPVAFAHIGPTQAFADTIATCVLALVRAGWLLGAIALTAALLDRDAPRRLALLTCVAVLPAAIFGAIEAVAIVPRMRLTPLGTPAYAALHAQSGLVFGLALLCALAGLALSSWRPAYR